MDDARRRRAARWLVTALVLVAVTGVLSSARAARSEATKTVTFRGYRVEVPASWPVVDLAKNPSACVRFDVHAVYLGHPGPEPSCPVRALGRTEALLVEPIDHVSKARVGADTAWAPAGKAAVRSVPSRTDHEVTLGVGDAGVLVTASYGDDRATLAKVLEGATLTGEAEPAPAQAQALSASAAAVTASVVAPGTYNGKGFDACTAPSPDAMQAWLANSPYRAVGVYIGGANRGCPQPELTPSWVSTQVAQGWHLIPIYVGLQAPCVPRTNLERIDPATAPAQGRAAAEDAVINAGSLGLGAGSVIYFDMEGYESATDPTCTQTVLTFLSNWSTRLHELGYLSGVYSSLSSGIHDLVSVYSNTSFVRPDHIWFARWNDVITVSDPSIPADAWADRQRIKQYHGDQPDDPAETYGGVTIRIDKDYLDVATPEPPPPPPVTEDDQDAPAVVTLGTEIHVLARGVDQRLYETVYRSGSGWSNWTARGTLTITGTPTVVKFGTGFNLYARGTDGQLHETYYRPGSGWFSWRAHPGTTIAGSPSAMPYGTGINVFARGADKRLYETYFRPSTGWSKWAPHAGVTVAGNPAAVAYGTEAHIFVRGADAGLYETFYRKGLGWSAWTPHAGATLAGDPEPLVYKTDIHVFARAADKRLYETYFRPTKGWSSWIQHGGSLAGDPAAVTYGDEMHVFARGTAGDLRERFYRPGVSWQPWASRAGVTVVGTPAAVTYSTDIHVFARVTNHRVYETYFRPSRGGWSAWSPKGGLAVGIA